MASLYEFGIVLRASSIWAESCWLISLEVWGLQTKKKVNRISTSNIRHESSSWAWLSDWLVSTFTISLAYVCMGLVDFTVWELQTYNGRNRTKSGINHGPGDLTDLWVLPCLCCPGCSHHNICTSFWNGKLCKESIVVLPREGTWTG